MRRVDLATGSNSFQHCPESLKLQHRTPEILLSSASGRTLNHMGKSDTRLKVRFAVSVARGVRFVVAPLYTALFGRLEEALYWRNRKRFILEIESAFSKVMARHGGSIVPGEGEEMPRAFDYAVVTVAFVDLRVRLIRGREELVAQLATVHNPHDWEEMSRLWRREALNECGAPPTVYDHLDEVAERLERCWDRLVPALASTDH